MIAEQIRAHGVSNRDSAAISTPDETVSYDRLTRRATTLARLLARENLAPTEQIAIVMTNTAGAAAALLGAALAGHPAVLIPPSMPEGERNQTLELARASVVVRDGGVEAAGGRQGHRSSGPDLGLPGDAFICQLNSGSLGPSRLAVRTHAGVAAEIEAVTRRLQLGPEDRVLCASSISHSYGLIGGLLAPLSVGGSVGLAAGPREAVSLVETVRPTVIVGLAATYRAFLADNLPAAALAGTRLALSAGAPLPDEIFAGFRSRFGLPIRQDYGTTETGTISIDLSRVVQPGCVGAPLDHMQVRVVVPEDIPLEGKEEGEILVRSAAVSPFYLSNGSLIGSHDPEGWYRTRDAGWMDGAGRLWVGRRLRAAIHAGGVQIYPDAAERAIRSLPGVRDVVVVPGVTGSGPAVKAFVVAPGLDAAGVERRWRDLFPQAPLVVELIDALPRSPAGKVLQKYMV